MDFCPSVYFSWIQTCCALFFYVSTILTLWVHTSMKSISLAGNGASVNKTEMSSLLLPFKNCLLSNFWKKKSSKWWLAYRLVKTDGFDYYLGRGQEHLVNSWENDETHSSLQSISVWNPCNSSMIWTIWTP